MSKGERTKAVILDQALALTTTDGLSGLTIGTLADATGMSKSGLFAHFGSKEQLQAAVLERATELYAETVVGPAMKAPRGLPRLIGLFEGWLVWSRRDDLPGGCPFMAAAIEVDDKPGPLRDLVAGSQDRLRVLLAGMTERAIEAGHLKRDLDVDGFVFELTGLYFAYNHMNRLLRNPQSEGWLRRAFKGLLERSMTPEAPPLPDGF